MPSPLLERLNLTSTGFMWCQSRPSSTSKFQCSADRINYFPNKHLLANRVTSEIALIFEWFSIQLYMTHCDYRKISRFRKRRLHKSMCNPKERKYKPVQVQNSEVNFGLCCCYCFCLLGCLSAVLIQGRSNVVK